MKFGLLWKDGRGPRSVDEQKEWLSDEGVAEKRMSFSAPPGRARSTTYACYIAAFGHDPEGKKRRSIRFAIEEYVRYTQEGARLHVLEFDRTYQGVEGFRDFLFDWLDRVGKQQTSKARKTRRRQKKDPFPRFYRALSPAEKRKFAREFQNWTFKGVPDMAHAYGTSEPSIWRAARVLNLTRPRRK